MVHVIATDETDAWKSEALTALGGGACVAIPTETVYGLAADATNGIAIARIFEMKGRPRFNPLICHVADIAMAQGIGEMNATAMRLAGRFWPGPLTLVVPVRPDSKISELVTAGLSTIGLRCPGGSSRRLIAAFGRPLAAPSANRSGRISPTTAAHVAQEFAGTDLVILDAGPCEVGIESTILKVEDDRLVLLRPGAITAQEIEAASGLAVESATGGAIQAPGMMASHYAPDASVVLNATRCPPGAGLLAFGDGRGRWRDDAAIMRNLSAGGDLREAAANLYRMLKEIDAARPALIAVEPIPGAGLGAAINDRLNRAAAPREPA